MDDRNAPATKGDLSDLKVELKGDIASLNEKIDVFRSEVRQGYKDMEVEKRLNIPPAA